MGNNFDEYGNTIVESHIFQTQLICFGDNFISKETIKIAEYDYFSISLSSFLLGQTSRTHKYIKELRIKAPPGLEKNNE